MSPEPLAPAATAKAVTALRECLHAHDLADAYYSPLLCEVTIIPYEIRQSPPPPGARLIGRYEFPTNARAFVEDLEATVRS